MRPSLYETALVVTSYSSVPVFCDAISPPMSHVTTSDIGGLITSKTNDKEYRIKQPGAVNRHDRDDPELYARGKHFGH